jgi:hypothetical protein
LLPANQVITSLLALDISPEVIKACLIEREEGVYRLAGVSRTPTFLNPQGSINRKDLTRALSNLMNNSGHDLLADNGNVRSPAESATSGVDRIALSWSLPVPIKVILFGLMPTGSINAGLRLIEELPLEIVGQLSATDGCSDEDRMDMILAKRPELILLTGGIEGGADNILRLSVDLVARSIAVLPQDLRPVVVFAGNYMVAEYVKTKLEPLTLIFTAPNVQPRLSEMDIQPAREVLSDVCNRMWLKRFSLQPGTRPLVINQIRPSIRAIEDFLAILGISEKRTRGCIAIQLDGLATSLSVNRDGRSTSHQQINGCMRLDPGMLVSQYQHSDVAPWSSDPIDSVHLAEYLATGSLYAGRLPITGGDASIEESLTRVAGIRTWQALSKKHDFPKSLISRDFCADADIILITGSRQDHQQKRGLGLLQMLDILQPIGLCDAFYDQDGIAACLGTAAHLDASIPLHCLLGRAIPRLATIIAPVHKAREGSRLLSMVVVEQDGRETRLEIPAGGLSSFPLRPGTKAEVRIRLHGGAGMGVRFIPRSGVTVEGSLLGILIDARGRPLVLRKDPDIQQEWLKNNKQKILEIAR